jgi:replication factor A1
MRAHYALVDDLIGWEEYEGKVQETVEGTGGVLDERTASMLVVRDFGRQHLKIRNLNSTSSRLVSFFGKVLSYSEPRQFDREDKTKGQVARVYVGDDSGETTLVLWDERAMVTEELSVGDVLEIVGQVKNRSEVQVQDLQMTAVTLHTREEVKIPGDCPLVLAKVLHLEDVHTYSRRDESLGEMVRGIFGNEEGTSPFVCWEPALIEGVQKGDVVQITGVSESLRDGSIEYSFGDKATLVQSDSEISVPYTPVKDVTEGRTVFVRGKLIDVQESRRFMTRKGTPASVRNAVVRDDSGSLPLVIWGDVAELPWRPGDQVEIIHGRGKNGRFHPIELHVGWQGAISYAEDQAEEISFSGTVIPTSMGCTLDDGFTWYLLDRVLPAGMQARVSGIVKGKQILVHATEPLNQKRSIVEENLNKYT